MSLETLPKKVQTILSSPWKIKNELKRYIATPFYKIYFWMNGIKWGKEWKLYGKPVIQRNANSYITFGPALSLRSSLTSNPLGPNHPVIVCTWEPDARIQVGSNFAMTGGTICAALSITIGDYVAVGANTTIIDTDFHPVNFEARREDSSAGACAPVRIGDHVFIGMNCIILKGVTLGNGCVIAAGSIVTKDIPEGMIAGGNPARILTTIDTYPGSH
jgi:acetyltransferase-like isoleucine patch superfamily enzyme